MIAQCLGAIVASALLLGALPREVGGKVFYAANMLTMNRAIGNGPVWSMPIGGAVLLEIVATFLLVSVVFAVAKLRTGIQSRGSWAP